MGAEWTKLSPNANGEASQLNTYHIHFVGSNSLLGHVVVVSGDIRFEEILPRSADSIFKLPKK